jgi:hypothetical protein
MKIYMDELQNVTLSRQNMKMIVEKLIDKNSSVSETKNEELMS